MHLHVHALDDTWLDMVRSPSCNAAVRPSAESGARLGHESRLVGSSTSVPSEGQIAGPLEGVAINAIDLANLVNIRWWEHERRKGACILCSGYGRIVTVIEGARDSIPEFHHR